MCRYRWGLARRRRGGGQSETLFSAPSQGKGLPLHYQSWYCVQQAIQANQTIQISAAKSRLDKVFFTMTGSSDLDCRDFKNPGETFEFGLQLGSKSSAVRTRRGSVRVMPTPSSKNCASERLKRVAETAV